MAGVDNGSFSAVGWTADGEQLYAGGSYGTRRFRFPVWIWDLWRRDAGTPVRFWDLAGRGKGRDAVVAKNSIHQLLPCGTNIAVAASGLAFGLISASGDKRVWQDGVNADMRGNVGTNFTVSNDGSKVHFGLGGGGADPVLFDIKAGRLNDQPESIAGLSAPDTTSLNLSHWRNSDAPKLNGKPLELEHTEFSHSAAIAPGGDRIFLGTDWSLRAYSKDGEMRGSVETPGTAWGLNIPRGGRFVIAAFNDGTIRWYRLSDGKEVLALFVNTKTREWVL